MSVKPIQKTEFIGFSKGLMTDANPLASAIEYTRDEVNFEFHPDGARSRRLGLDREMFGSDFDTGISWDDATLSQTTSYLWDVVAGDPELTFVVIQLEDKIYFFQPNAGVRGETILKGQLTIPHAATIQLRYSTLDGYLGITNGTPDIGIVEYKVATGLFEFSTFRITIRDQFGVEETQDPLYETDPQHRAALTQQHYYNLYNQGWAIPRKAWSNGTITDAVTLGTKNGKVPSNSDSIWLGMDQKPLFDTSTDNYEAFNYSLFEGALGSDSKTGKGFFLIDAFNRGASRLTRWNAHKVTFTQAGKILEPMEFLSDSTSGGPSSMAAHAGRFFYSGVKGSITNGDHRSPNWNNAVFFTQLVNNRVDFGKCYQEGDPTSRESSDVVDTDGGFFFISEAKNIHSMYSFGDRLFLLAENGVWSVSGGSNYGFNATNYKVEKISSFGGIDNQSFVEFAGIGYFWGWDGIYAIQKNQFGDYEVTNIAKDVIGNFYSLIPAESKATCQGFVDNVRRQIRWVYNTGTWLEDAVSNELILDTKFKAFYPFTIPSHPDQSAYLLTGAQFNDFTTTLVDGAVRYGDSLVLYGDSVLRTEFSRTVAMDSNVKYVTIRPSAAGKLIINFCEYRNTAFEDWAFTGSPIDAAGYMETNAVTGGDFTVSKQVPYLHMAFKDTEETYFQDSGDINIQSSCLGRFKWDFANLARSGKWSREQQLYRKSKFYYDTTDVRTGFELVITKTKLRGIGKSLALRVETEPAKDCHIFGWSLSLTGNST